jgi:uncharacterized protein
VQIFPREVEFFDLLEKQAGVVNKAAITLARCLESKPAFDRIVAMCEQVHTAEHEGDDIVHQLMDRLNKTFLTPLDREDIYALCTRLDDVLDYIDAVAKRLVTFKIDSLTPQAIELVRIIECAAAEVEAGIRLLRNLKRHEEIVRQCARINQLENDADQVLREALNRLFNDEAHDPIYVIKWKDLYEHMELATDKCEDVANVIETVLVKYS